MAKENNRPLYRILQLGHQCQRWVEFPLLDLGILTLLSEKRDCINV